MTIAPQVLIYCQVEGGSKVARLCWLMQHIFGLLYHSLPTYAAGYREIVGMILCLNHIIEFLHVGRYEFMK